MILETDFFSRFGGFGSYFTHFAYLLGQSLRYDREWPEYSRANIDPNLVYWIRSINTVICYMPYFKTVQEEKYQGFLATLFDNHMGTSGDSGLDPV